MTSSIKVLRGCGASGQSLVAGAVYAVPAQVSETDAALLVRLGKAEISSAVSSAAGAAPDAPAKADKAKKPKASS